MQIDEFLNGEAREVAEELGNTPPSEIAQDEIVAALSNALRRIHDLEWQVKQFQSDKIFSGGRQ